MTRAIALANQKGGVGKTTTCVNLGAALAEGSRRVLVVDLDPQGNATMGCGIDKREVETTAYDVLMGHVALDRVLLELNRFGFDLVPANADLTAATVELMEAEDRERRLRRALAPVRERYDYIFIDCPPALNMLTVNALAGADGVMIPMQCEYYALEGLTDLLDTVKRVRQTVNTELQLEGLLRTMYDVRNRLANEVSSQLLRHFGDKVYTTVVPRNVRVAEAPSYGLPVIQHDRSSRGSLAYLGLAGEMMRRERKTAGASA